MWRAQDSVEMDVGVHTWSMHSIRGQSGEKSREKGLLLLLWPACMEHRRYAMLPASTDPAGGIFAALD